MPKKRREEMDFSGSYPSDADHLYIVDHFKSYCSVLDIVLIRARCCPFYHRHFHDVHPCAYFMMPKFGSCASLPFKSGIF